MKEWSIEKFSYLSELLGASGDNVLYVRMLLMSVVVILISVAMWWVTRKILLSFVHQFAKNSTTTWDDHLVDRNFFSALAQLAPWLTMDFFLGIVFVDFPKLLSFLQATTDLVTVFVLMIAMLRFVNAFGDVLLENERLRDKPIHSYLQLVKIIASGVFIIYMLSIMTNKDPVFFLTSLGAVSAVLLLIFKDTILGFVGSIQLAANDMIRIGDWVTVEKYGADGDVIEITLAVVKVQNFDKTITTIPTYSFIADSFKNWRGMTESGGRRIARAFNIKIDTVKFCTPEMIEKFNDYHLIADYINDRESEIQKFNEEKNIDKKVLLNGRHQTNLGLLRKYMHEYLASHPGVNKEMTYMVRQLAPTEYGVPIQVYCFSNSKDWPVYEGIQGDIFDHFFAAVSYFDLEIYERPAGSDFNKIEKSKKD